jgi:hypothetical protein
MVYTTTLPPLRPDIGPIDLKRALTTLDAQGSGRQALESWLCSHFTALDEADMHATGISINNLKRGNVEDFLSGMISLDASP